MKLPDSQLNKLKSATKYATDKIRLSSNIIGNNKINFSHSLPVTGRQVSGPSKALTNNSLVNVKLPKTQLSK